MIRRHRSSISMLTLALVALIACSEARAAETRAFVFATDFSTGSLSDIQFGPPRTVATGVASVSSDAVLRWHGGLLYVVNRFGFDNIQVLDPANSFATVQQFSVGNGSNPNDIAVVSPTKAYVTRYETADLWIVNPATGAHTGTISLAAFADADGIPEMHRLAIAAGRLFVSIQALDRNNFFAPTGLSQVAVIDVATDAIVDVDPAPGVQGIDLTLQNPTTELVVDPLGQIVFGCTGSYEALDGGVVRVDPAALTVSATEVTEAALGGNLSDVAVLSAERGFAVISDASSNTALKAYRRDLGTVQGILTSSGFFLADIEVNDRIELWVCDRNFAAPGVRVFDALTHAELTASPLSTGLPPQDIAFDGTSTVGVPPGPRATRGPSLEITGVWPNPSSDLVRVALSAPRDPAANATAEIVDLSGRSVWEGTVEVSGDGSGAFRWDGRDRSGQRAAPGIYFLNVRAGNATASARLVRIE